MENKEAFETVMQSDSVELASLADKIKNKYGFEITRKPTQGLMMFRVEESVELMDFNAGEILGLNSIAAITSFSTSSPGATSISVTPSFSSEKTARSVT